MSLNCAAESTKESGLLTKLELSSPSTMDTPSIVNPESDPVSIYTHDSKQHEAEGD
jgi:hypothetical protein